MEEGLQAALVVAHDGEGLSPEEAVVDDEEVHLLFQGLPEDGLPGVHRRPHLADGPLPLHLEAVQGGVLGKSWILR